MGGMSPPNPMDPMNLFGNSDAATKTADNAGLSGALSAASAGSASASADRRSIDEQKRALMNSILGGSGDAAIGATQPVAAPPGPSLS